ncbi:hypothetical protein PAMP_016844 [Pampus punctatissimus]
MDDKDGDLGVFDPNIPEEGPSAPPPGWLDDIHGYQGHRGGEDDNPLYPPPPAYTPQPELNRNTVVPDVRVHTVSEDVARDALLKFVESKWRYSSKPARNLTFKELKPITVYRYRLETYTETRTSAWQFEPYKGQMVDGPQYGMSPPPWDIPVSLPARYTDMVVKARVPHSSFVKKRCVLCHGHGHNHSSNRRCSSCNGRGRKRNVVPNVMARGTKGGTGKTSGPLGRRVVFLVAGEAVRVSEDATRDARKENKRKCQSSLTAVETFDGVCVCTYKMPKCFSFTCDKVYPIQGFPDQEICDVAAKLINEHLNRFSATSRILQQRQTIELVPLTHAHYFYNGKDFSFFVYGVENKVFTAKYPTACTIL